MRIWGGILHPVKNYVKSGVENYIHFLHAAESKAAAPASLCRVLWHLHDECPAGMQGEL